MLWRHCIATLSWSRLKATTTIILSFGKQTPQEGLVGLLRCAAAGVFVHCWSSLLSPICCCSLAWKQDQECFHTYAHWPLINKSDRGPFPHIHTTRMNTKSTHTETRSLITEASQSSLPRSPPHLSYHTRQPIFLSIKADSLQWRLNCCFFLAYLLFSLMTVPQWQHHQTQGDLFSSAVHVLFLSGWIGKTIVQICYLICPATMNGHIEEENEFAWPASFSVSAKKEQRPGLRKETTLYLQRLFQNRGKSWEQKKPQKTQKKAFQKCDGVML